MSFIREKFSDKVEILCPCGRCLNQKYQCQVVVKKHILTNGMDISYTRWKLYKGRPAEIETFF